VSTLFQLLRWDFTMQVRHGFWVAALFVLLPWVAVLLSVSQEHASFLLPALIFLDISVAGTLFMAGVYFFEKREGSLRALVVTPVRTWQWLTSKLVSLTVMGTVMCLVLVVVKKGIHAPWGYVLVAILCINVLFILFGFILAAPNDRFTNFFLYFALFFGVMEVPLSGLLRHLSPTFLAPADPACAGSPTRSLCRHAPGSLCRRARCAAGVDSDCLLRQSPLVPSPHRRSQGSLRWKTCG